MPPWRKISLADVFCQILRKDPGEDDTGRGTTTFLPSGLRASSARALQGTESTIREKCLSSQESSGAHGPK